MAVPIRLSISKSAMQNRDAYDPERFLPRGLLLLMAAAFIVALLILMP